MFVSRITQNYLTDFHKIRLKAAHGLRKKWLDGVGNPDHVTLGFFRV